MGGTLDPETTPGGGLTMILALPAATRPDRPERRPADRAILDACTVTAPRRGRAMTRILVVDDEPQILRALRINLAPGGTTSTSPPTARTRCAAAAATGPTWSCSTSACPTWTASR